MKTHELIDIGSSVLKAHLLKRSYPLNVVLTVTTRCNFRCQYCKIWARNEKDMSLDEIISLINELSINGTKRLSFYGGEPLLREDIGEIIDYGKKKGLFLTINTNGFLLEQNLDKIRKIDIITLSFDGSPEIHDSQKYKGAYENLMRAIKVSRKEKIQVWTTTTLTKNNIDQIDFILNKSRELDFFTNFQLVHHPPAASGDANWLITSAEEYRKAILKLIENKRLNKTRIINSLEYFKVLYNWPDYHKPCYPSKENNFTKNVKCWAGKLFCHIDSNGDLYACHQHLKKIKIYNILDGGFLKAFKNIQKIDCEICLAGDYLEYNLLFSLHLGAVYNTLRWRLNL